MHKALTHILKGKAVGRISSLDNNELQKNAIVMKYHDNYRVESIIKDKQVDLILLEISKDVPSEIEIIKNVKRYHPNIEIIIINEDREVIARALSYEAGMVFQHYYCHSLITH